MNDQELAAEVVALGVGEKSTWDGTPNTEFVWLIGSVKKTGSAQIVTVEKFVRDWRIAGELLELCYDKGFLMAMIMNSAAQEPPESLARNLIEACVRVLKAAHNGM